MYPRNKVKCPVCEVKFDRNCVEFVAKNNRYYHTDCFEKLEEVEAKNKLEKKVVKKSKASTNTDKETEDYKELISYICQLREEQRPSMAVLAQIKRYKEFGYTYAGIKMSLEYFHVLKGNPVLKDKGIGIVESVYDTAKEYYQKRYETLLKNSEVEYEKIEYHYGRPAHLLEKKHEQKLINLEEIKWT